MEDNDKSVLTLLGFFLGGVFCGYLIEDFYRQFVRFVFWIFNGNHIQFTGKNFHLFASNPFVFAFGIFIVVVFLFLTVSIREDRLKKVVNVVLLFLFSSTLTSTLDSKRLLLECTQCTQCTDGIRKIGYNEVGYDSYFVVSLSASIIYLLITYYYEIRSFSKRFTFNL